MSVISIYLFTVPLGEEGEVVPANGEKPPAHLEKNQRDQDTYLESWIIHHMRIRE